MRGLSMTSLVWRKRGFRRKWVGREGCPRAVADKGRRWDLFPESGSDCTLLYQQQNAIFLLADFLCRSPQALLEPLLF